MDNGCEFNNESMRDLGDAFGIQLLNTAAQFPWSNGTCERLNQILSISVKWILEETNCNVKIALSWAVTATLHNFSGFSPIQLVFGRNPTFPCVSSYSEKNCSQEGVYNNRGVILV